MESLLRCLHNLESLLLAAGIASAVTTDP
jgi:hypothetical protein